jgi:transcriptional regulator with XRE-family HTH domain
MPRKTPVSQFEKEIGARCRQARELSRFKQADLARRVGIEPNRLTGYELGRNPLPYWVGDAIARETHHSQRWLVTGKLPAVPYFKVAETAEEMIPEAMAFSAAYALLECEIEEQLTSAAKISRCAIEELDTDDHDPFFLENRTALLATPIEKLQEAVDLELKNLDEKSVGMPKAKLQRLLKELRRLTRHFDPKHGEYEERRAEAELERKKWRGRLVPKIEEARRRSR